MNRKEINQLVLNKSISNRLMNVQNCKQIKIEITFLEKSSRNSSLKRLFNFFLNLMINVNDSNLHVFIELDIYIE